MKKSLPSFQSEPEEQTFWATHDSVDFLDWTEPKPALFPDLQPTTKDLEIDRPAP